MKDEIKKVDEEKSFTEGNDQDRRHDERREDGTKGGLRIDPDGATRKQDKDDEATTDGGGTGIPGFGV